MDLIQELMGLFKDFAHLDTPAKAATIVMALIALWKSSFLAPYWDKLGGAKVIVYPILGLLLSVFQLPNFDFAHALPILWVALKTGALAVGFHALVQALESAPWLGDKYKKWLDVIDNLLFKPRLPKDGVVEVQQMKKPVLK